MIFIVLDKEKVEMATEIRISAYENWPLLNQITTEDLHLPDKEFKGFP